MGKVTGENNALKRKSTHSSRTEPVGGAQKEGKYQETLRLCMTTGTIQEKRWECRFFWGEGACGSPQKDRRNSKLVQQKNEGRGRYPAPRIHDRHPELKSLCDCGGKRKMSRVGHRLPHTN